MNHSIKNLIGFYVYNNETRIGTLRDFSFDENTWTIQHLIVETGDWFSERLIYISVQALLKIDLTAMSFLINLSRAQIVNQLELNMEMDELLQRSDYWFNHCPQTESNFFELDKNKVLVLNKKNIHLKASKECHCQQIFGENSSEIVKNLKHTNKIIGYKIINKLNKIGEVDDFIINLSKWKIDFIVINSSIESQQKQLMLSLR